MSTARRTYRFAVLGMALANQFDVKEPQDLLRGLSNVLSEYELLKEDADKPKIVRARILLPSPRRPDLFCAV